jgi:hypothetical protein
LALPPPDFPDYDLWIVVLENQDTDGARRAAFTALSEHIDPRD